MKTVIVHKDLGIFLGELSGMLLFAKTDMVGIPGAYGFGSSIAAKVYIQVHAQEYMNDVFYQDIDTDGPYVKLSDLLKADLGDHTHNMLYYLKGPSEALH